MTASSSNGSSSHSKQAGISIKPHEVQPPSDVSGMKSQEIMQILHNLDAEGTAQAGGQFSTLGESLNRIAAQIRQHGNRLAENWKGKSAAAAVNEFKRMHDYAAQLAAQATQTGEVLKWLGSDVLPKYKRLPDPSATAASPEHANAVARNYLTSLSHHIVAANKAMPSRIVGEAPAKSTGKVGKVHPGSGPVHDPFPGPGAPGPGPAPGPGLITGPGPVPAPGTPIPAPTAGHLASAGPVAPPAPTAAAPTSAWPGSGWTGSNGLSAVPIVPGSMGSGAVGEGAPAAADSAAAEAAGAGAAGAAGAEEGMSALPMMGGGAGGKGDSERQRQAWMAEDDEIWGLPADAFQSPLLGADEPR
jgi:uncharacterized protein YukE